MKVKELKEKLENIDDDMEVVLCDVDERYRKLYSFSVEWAEVKKDRYSEYLVYIDEDEGPDNIVNKVKVLTID
jgi:hypothetical protein